MGQLLWACGFFCAFYYRFYKLPREGSYYMPLLYPAIIQSFTRKKMINRRIQHHNTLQQAQQYPLLTTLNYTQELIDYSNQNCFCFVHPTINVKISCAIVQLDCQPKVGLFKGIDFKLKILLNCVSPHNKPGIYNDRRVFHPNINLISCELVSRLIKGRLRSIDVLSCFDQFELLVKHIIEIIVSPDCSFVADNRFNRKAAWHYFYNQANYGRLILENCPFNLNKVLVGEYAHDRFSYLSYYDLSSRNEANQSYWSIENTITKSRYQSKSFLRLQMSEFQFDKQQDFRSKAIKCFLEQQNACDDTAEINYQK